MQDTKNIDEINLALRGKPVEFTVPEHRKFAEIEEVYANGKAKLRIWVVKDDETQVHRFETRHLGELTFLER